MCLDLVVYVCKTLKIQCRRHQKCLSWQTFILGRIRCFIWKKKVLLKYSKNIQTSFCLHSSCLLWNDYWGQGRNQELSKHSAFYIISCFPVTIFCLSFPMSLYRTCSAYQNGDTMILRAESPWQWFIRSIHSLILRSRAGGNLDGWMDLLSGTV